MLAVMGQYSALNGKRVEARYRAGDIQLSACGNLVAETARAVFLEERFFHNGREKKIRVEIPHEYLLDLLESMSALDDSPSVPSSAAAKQA